MHFHKKLIIFSLITQFFSIGNVFADGVFLEKQRDGHKLSSSEQRQLTMEFYQRFGKSKSEPAVRSNNPWEAKKQRQQSQRSVSWGECRDFALQKRNLCYKQGRDAYNCERFYEARTQKCNTEF